MSEALGSPGVSSGLAVPSPRAFARSGAVLAIATVIANLLGYAFAVVLSRALGPGGYGALAALLALGMIGSIPAIALQLVVARELVSTDTVAAVWLKTSLVLGAALLALFWAIAPVAQAYLGLASPLPVLWIGVALLPTTATGALQGVLLGRQRYGGLAASYLLLAGLRFAGGCVAAATGTGVSGALAAAAAGTAVACLAVAVVTASKEPILGPAPAEAIEMGVRQRLDALVAAASATAAILVLTSLDVILARHFLTASDSGHYGVGALFAKASFWAPHFIAVLSFPLLASRDSRRRAFVISASLTLAIGCSVVLGAGLFARLVIEATVGGAYDDVEALAARFALLGVLTAILQLLLYAGLARRSRRVELLVWIGIGVQLVVVSAWFHESARQIVNASIVVCAALGVLIAITGLRSGARA